MQRRGTDDGEPVRIHGRVLDTSGTPFAYVSQDSIYMKPGDFKWWLFLDTWIGELRSGSRYEKYEELYRKWMKKDPPPQRFYDYSKY